MVPDRPVSTTDPYNLQRFVEAQHDDYEDVCTRASAQYGHNRVTALAFVLIIGKTGTHAA
jgi:uncharacterized protein (DUF1810 family)